MLSECCSCAVVVHEVSKRHAVECWCSCDVMHLIGCRLVAYLRIVSAFLGGVSGSEVYVLESRLYGSPRGAVSARGQGSVKYTCRNVRRDQRRATSTKAHACLPTSRDLVLLVLYVVRTCGSPWARSDLLPDRHSPERAEQTHM
jgi:hypothetical protein